MLRSPNKSGKSSGHLSFFRDTLEVNFIQSIPILQRELDSEGGETRKFSDISIHSDSCGRFLISIFDEWVQKDVGKVFVQIFDIALSAWLGAPAGLCVFAETCGHALVFEHNGDVYACDHFVNSEHLLGNITHDPLIDMVNSKSQVQFGLNKKRACHPNAWFARCGLPVRADAQKIGMKPACIIYAVLTRHFSSTARWRWRK